MIARTIKIPDDAYGAEVIEHNINGHTFITVEWARLDDGKPTRHWYRVSGEIPLEFMTRERQYRKDGVVLPRYKRRQDRRAYL